MTVDSMYKENLSEWIYDEHKLITYQYLSVTLGVHINMAKQMLYEFYMEEKKKQDKAKKSAPGKKMKAIFLLSGTEARSEESSELLKFTTTLCSEEKLEEHKNKLKSIYSVHIYSLQCDLSEEDCVSKLRDAVEEATFLKDTEGRCGVDFGPYKLMKPDVKKKAIPIEPVAIVLVKPEEVKSKSLELGNDETKALLSPSHVKKEDKDKKIKEKSKRQDSLSNPNNQSSTKKISSGKSSNKKAVTTNAQSKTRLQNMFAAAASKPRAPKKEKSPEPINVESTESSEDEESQEEGNIEIEVEPESLKSAAKTKKLPQETKKPPQKRSDKRKALPKKQLPAQKRKRIQQVFSSSDEDNSESEKMSAQDEEESNTESPIPRKKFQIESDSDDEDFVGKPASNESSDLGPAGTKRVNKTISRTYMKEDGFMLTVKEQVLVSASESEEEKEKEITEPHKKVEEQIKLDSPQTTKSDLPVKMKTPAMVNASKSKDLNSQKMKQIFLTSFFKRRP